MIFCCIPCLIWNSDVNQGTIWCKLYYTYTNNLYKPASLIDDQADVVWRIPSDYNYMYLTSLISD